MKIALSQKLKKIKWVKTDLNFFLIYLIDLKKKFKEVTSLISQIQEEKSSFLKENRLR